ncbi:MAG TPA: YdeI/OmpD-associated family protein [Mycobacteriales bacterium]|nr:YdeI/OmpD-associated family protein [Mycobacteriales bacterium]
MSELPVLAFAEVSEWEAWLAEHHSSAGIWISFAKVSSGIPSITHDQALEVALCFGWIDGQVKRTDAEHWVQRFTPRRKKSRWSQVNREKAERLIAEGRMQPPGHEQIAAAQADGRWEEAYRPPSRSTVPDDLAAAFELAPRAREFFATLDSRNRYAVLYRIEQAKRPETRARRIATFVEMLGRGETLH